MRIVVNGEGQDVPEGTTVRRLLEMHDAPLERVAVEVNRTIVPRGRHEAHRLRDGDRIEVVTFVGGG